MINSILRIKYNVTVWLRNKSWKPECVGSFNMGWQILVLISTNPCLNSKHILASMIYFDSDMSKSTNMVVYFDWKTVIKSTNKVWRLIVFAPFLIIIIILSFFLSFFLSSAKSLSDTFLGDYWTEINETSQEC